MRFRNSGYRALGLACSLVLGCAGGYATGGTATEVLDRLRSGGGEAYDVVFLEQHKLDGDKRLLTVRADRKDGGFDFYTSRCERPGGSCSPFRKAFSMEKGTEMPESRVCENELEGGFDLVLVLHRDNCCHIGFMRDYGNGEFGGLETIPDDFECGCME